MYALMIIDAVLRVVTALVLLFIAVPALAYRRPESLDRMQWFWWCLGFGVSALTWGGQLLSLVRSFSAAPLVLVILLFVLFMRARSRGESVRTLVARMARMTMLFTLNLVDGRISITRRMRRSLRRTRARFATAAHPRTRWIVAGSIGVAALAGFYRLLRPFSTANLGSSDAYPHLYLVQLLKQGIQIDPAYGPYPRGMHFLLLAIHELTNVDLSLLINCFGSLAGVLLTISVADAARRLTGGWRGALLAGALFAVAVGGPGQYFLLGGVFQVTDGMAARGLLAEKYEVLAERGGEFDILLTSFQRQTVTLPQELALVFLFPAALFLLEWFRTKGKWQLAGFAGCSAAVACIHSGVVVPLAIVCGVSVLAAASEGHLRWPVFRRAVLLGLGAIVAGSSWTLGFFHSGFDRFRVAGGFLDGIAAYFPFVSGVARDRAEDVPVYVSLTPFLTGTILVAVAMLVRAAFVRPELRGALVWPAAATLTFSYIHVASMLGLPQIVPLSRNTSWFVMSMAVLVTKTLVELAEVARDKGGRARTRYAFPAVAAILVAVWVVRAPDVAARQSRRSYYVFQTGYGAVAFATLRIEKEFQPFTWTLVTYGQEFPMVLGKGFHIAAAEFLNRFDPRMSPLGVPTRYVFVAVEKTPHPFEINDWAVQYSRAELEKRLQTWCYVYQSTHDNIRLYLEDENVRVYVIEQSDLDLARLAASSKR